VAVLFMVIAGTVGFLLFSRSSLSVPWLAPWLLTCLLTGLGLVVSPLIAVLEGCDQMGVVNRYRFQQVATSHPLVWSGILAGAQLWVVVISVSVMLFWDIWLTLRTYRAFWRSLWHAERVGTVHWKKEVWPLQWRAALRAPFLYLSHQLFTPVMFYYHGAAAAGAMGMTWSVLSILQQAAIVWPQSRAPRFGALIARGERIELDRLFLRVTVISTLVLLSALGLFSAAVAAVYVIDHPLTHHVSRRVLPPETTLVFSVALLLRHIPHCMNIYMQSHKKMPFLWISVFSDSLVAAAVWGAGSRGGPLAAGLALLAVTALARLPGNWAVWHHYRKTWNEQAASAAQPGVRKS
jgi:hypothetical protein